MWPWTDPTTGVLDSTLDEDTHDSPPKVVVAVSSTTYRVTGVSRPGGHGRIECNTTKVKVDTGSLSDGIRPGPAELLCAALAACLLKNVERYSEILPFRYEVASVTIEAERHDVPPAITKMHYRLVLVTDEPAHRVELLHHNILKFGTITNTLAVAVELTGEVAARHPSELSRLQHKPRCPRVAPTL